MKNKDDLCNALQQMIDGTNTMNVPARKNEDADLILAQGISEHEKMKVLLQKARLALESWNLQAGDENTLSLIKEICDLQST